MRLLFDAKPESENFKIKWTPTLIILDGDGEEHHRTTGFLDPGELLPMIALGSGKSHFDRGEYADAMASLDKLLDDYPKSDSAAEAIYYRAVSGYKHTNNPQPLKQGYEMLQAQYPNSEWTKRAAPYRLL